MRGNSPIKIKKNTKTNYKRRTLIKKKNPSGGEKVRVPSARRERRWNAPQKKLGMKLESENHGGGRRRM